MQVQYKEYQKFLRKLEPCTARHMFTGKASCPTSQTIEHVSSYGMAEKHIIFKRGKQVAVYFHIYPNSLNRFIRSRK